jgi:uncharacterized protein (UPF0276 family)
MTAPAKVSKNGIGLGLRVCHYDEFFRERRLSPESSTSLGWVEVISENYMAWTSHWPQRPVETLEKVRQLTDVALHGVALSIGSSDEPDLAYLKSLKNLASRIEPIVISDHLCWTSVDGEQLHDLLPLPRTKESLSHVVDKISRVQDYLGRQILIENVSSYLEFSVNTMTEVDFITQIVQQSGCGLLLDVNNVYVNAVNHGTSASSFLDSLPAGCVGQIHLAGHSKREGYLIDTHDAPVCDEVWDLYEQSLQKFGPVNAMIEWDAQIPTWSRLLKEVEKIHLRQQKLSGKLL